MKKTVVSMLSALSGAALGAGIMGKVRGRSLDEVRNLSEKHLALFLMMNRWVQVKQEGKNLSAYFEKNGYEKIAIYGMSYAGETLLGELRDTDTTVLYAIDRNADAICADVDIVSLEDEWETVDAIVVTAVTFFDEIEEMLLEKVDCPILSLEDVLYEI